MNKDKLRERGREGGRGRGREGEREMINSYKEY